MTTAAICATREVSWRLSFYRGEQYDQDLALYYLRARYYNPATGRFMSRDPEDGYAKDPATLHKYLYAGGDPVNGWDPTGRDGLFGYAWLTGKTVLKASAYLWACGQFVNDAFKVLSDILDGKGASIHDDVNVWLKFGACETAAAVVVFM